MSDKITVFTLRLDDKNDYYGTVIQVSRNLQSIVDEIKKNIQGVDEVKHYVDDLTVDNVYDVLNEMRDETDYNFDLDNWVV